MNLIIRIELSKNVIVGHVNVISCTVNASRCYKIGPFDLDGASNIIFKYQSRCLCLKIRR